MRVWVRGTEIGITERRRLWDNGLFENRSMLYLEECGNFGGSMIS